MRTFLIILFFLLYVGNNYICFYFYPDAREVEAEWYKWDDLRKLIYEVMFFVLCVSSIWNQDKLSRALASGVAFIVLCSFIDKAGGVFGYHIHDLIVLSVSAFIVQRTHSILSKNERKSDL